MNLLQKLANTKFLLAATKPTYQSSPTKTSMTITIPSGKSAEVILVGAGGDGAGGVGDSQLFSDTFIGINPITNNLVYGNAWWGGSGGGGAYVKFKITNKVSSTIKLYFKNKDAVLETRTGKKIIASAGTKPTPLEFRGGLDSQPSVVGGSGGKIVNGISGITLIQSRNGQPGKGGADWRRLHNVPNVGVCRGTTPLPGGDSVFPPYGGGGGGGKSLRSPYARLSFCSGYNIDTAAATSGGSGYWKVVIV